MVSGLIVILVSINF